MQNAFCRKADKSNLRNSCAVLEKYACLRPTFDQFEDIVVPVVITVQECGMPQPKGAQPGFQAIGELNSSKAISKSAQFLCVYCMYKKSLTLLYKMGQDFLGIEQVLISTNGQVCYIVNKKLGAYTSFVFRGKQRHLSPPPSEKMEKEQPLHV